MAEGYAMANEEHLAQLKQGVIAWNRWRVEHPETTPDLRHTDLHEAQLQGMNFQETEFQGANLRWVDLRWADLRSADLSAEVDLYSADLRTADLRDADLRGANLRQANLHLANLRGACLETCDLQGAILWDANLTSANLTAANLAGVDLRRANLYGALLNHANLEGAVLGGTILANIDLGSTLGLSGCIHEGPSSLDYATLSKSVGIPQTFLLGSGLPQAFIDFLPSLTGRPFKFYSCFISYTSRDMEFAHKLHADLQELGIRAWFAPEELRADESIRDQLGAAIRAHDILVLILSRESIKSDWVKHEVEKALTTERETQRTILFPLMLDDSIFQKSEPWAEALKQRFILDFSSWKNDQLYLSSLSRLAKALTLTASGEMLEGR
jgi:uncharacterized protein YjbI with pentapeptide repeats